jgi:hypothetical protein
MSGTLQKLKKRLSTSLIHSSHPAEKPPEMEPLTNGTVRSNAVVTSDGHTGELSDKVDDLKKIDEVRMRNGKRVS